MIEVKDLGKEGLARVKARHLRASILRTICAYYDPDRTTFGNKSLCVKCCKGTNEEYDSSSVPCTDGGKICKRWHIIANVVNGLDKQMI